MKEKSRSLVAAPPVSCVTYLPQVRGRRCGGAGERVQVRGVT